MGRLPPAIVVRPDSEIEKAALDDAAALHPLSASVLGELMLISMSSDLPTSSC